MMGQPVDFPGSNLDLGAPEGRDDVVPMRAFANRMYVVECWQLTPAEVQEVVMTGRVWVSLMTGGSGPNPVLVGGEDTVRRFVADYGTWRKST
jgi:hypothetical protein